MSKKQRKTFDAISDSDHITLSTTLHDRSTVTQDSQSRIIFKIHFPTVSKHDLNPHTSCWSLVLSKITKDTSTE